MIGGPIGWLVGAWVVSMVAAFVLWRTVGHLFELVGIARAVVFGAIWTAVGTLAGMRSMTSKARNLRTGNARVAKHLKGDK